MSTCALGLAAGVLRFNDPRRFGCLLWQPPGETHELLQALGPEPLSDGFDGDYLFDAQPRPQGAGEDLPDGPEGGGRRGQHLRRRSAVRRRHLAAARGRQGLARTLCAAGRVREATSLAYAIDRGGTTLRDFISPDGEPGYFELELSAYGRGGEPCPRCGRPLKQAAIGQRTTVWCGHCQK